MQLRELRVWLLLTRPLQSKHLAVTAGSLTRRRSEFILNITWLLTVRYAHTQTELDADRVASHVQPTLHEINLTALNIFVQILVIV